MVGNHWTALFFLQSICFFQTRIENIIHCLKKKVRVEHHYKVSSRIETKEQVGIYHCCTRCIWKLYQCDHCWAEFKNENKTALPITKKQQQQQNKKITKKISKTNEICHNMRDSLESIMQSKKFWEDCISTKKNIIKSNRMLSNGNSTLLWQENFMHVFVLNLKSCSSPIFVVWSQFT